MLKQYRSDIDGLRALAVVLVVLYHVKMPYISGGFIGVDVFFVISGYLITSIINDKIFSGTFSYLDFYNRRIKRILPALFIVSASSFVAGCFLLGTGELLSLSRSILAASLSLSNLYFLHVSEGYFSPNTDELPLLHTWSLSVEEQFYFIWPATLLLLTKKLSSKLISGVLLIAITLSFAYSIYLTSVEQSSAYYLIASRCTGMLMGALLAVTGLRAKKFNSIIAYIAITIIIACALLITPKMPFPGYISFIPCLGAALYIYANDNSRRNIFISKPVVFIGLISYSMYLWHWPLSAFANYYDIIQQYKVKISIVIASAILAYLSLKFIETPVRKSRMGFYRSVSMILLPFIALSLIGWATAEKTKGFPARFNNDEYAKAVELTKFANLDHGWCHVSRDNENGIIFEEAMANCHTGDKSGKVKALFIGDSTAGHYGPFIDRMAKEAGVDVLQMSTSNCFPTFDPKGTGDKPDVCKNFRTRIKQAIDTGKFDFIIVSSYWQRDNNAISYKPGRNNYKGIMWYYSHHAKNVIVLGQPPEFRINSGACYLKGSMGNSKCDTSADFGPLMVYQQSNKVVENFTKEFKNVAFVDPSNYICNKEKCSPFFNGRPMYHDQTHLSEYGSELLAKLYLNDHKNPLK